MTRRRLGAALVAVLLAVALTLGGLALVRRNAAGTARTVSPPGGAVTALPEGGTHQRLVLDRAAIVDRSLRNDRGRATVRTYVLPEDSPWLRSRQIVATQLDHWEQLGDCRDRPGSVIVECAWREPTRWWPRTVQLTMLRPPPPGQNRDGWPDRTFVIIGSGLGG